MGFMKWFMENLYSNCFTIVTVIISGLISWIISAIYYHIGNRTNLKVSVILPIIELLQGNYTRENYTSLCKLSREYSVKYLRKKENEALTELKSAYKNVYSYQESSVNASILFSYFEDKLEANGVELKPIPIIVDDEIVEYEPPSGWFELLDDLERHLNKYDPNYQSEECQKAVATLFTKYSKQYYSSKDIEYFDDLCLKKILAQSELHAEWNQRFKAMKNAKERFLNLNIVKDILLNNQNFRK